MELIRDITDSLKFEIIDFLYKNELMNVLTLHYIENKVEEIGELYLSYNKLEIDCLLHIKDDGNSHFTTFYSLSDEGLNKISNQIIKMPHEDILLAGPSREVKYIMNSMGNNSKINEYSYYKHNIQLAFQPTNSIIKMRKALSNDVDIVGDLLISFFEANTQKSKDKIRSKIDLSKIRLFEIDNIIVGFASFFGYSKNYIDISSVYIDPLYRNKGYGKKLMQLMIKEAYDNGKIAILQADAYNHEANRIYTSVGFEKASEYTFKFLNEGK